MFVRALHNKKDCRNKDEKTPNYFYLRLMDVVIVHDSSAEQTKKILMMWHNHYENSCTMLWQEFIIIHLQDFDNTKSFLFWYSAYYRCTWEFPAVCLSH